KDSTPILCALRFNWLPVLMGFGIIAMSSGGYVIATTFVHNYATGPDVAIGADTILAAMTVASFVEPVVTLPLAALGDKWGGKMLLYLGIGLSFSTMIPLLLSTEADTVASMFVLVSVIRLTLSVAWAPLSALMAHMFRPQARYTSMSLAYGLGAAVWGGLAPAIASGLMTLTSSIWSAVAFFGQLSAVAWLGTAFAPQHRDAVDTADPTIDSTVQTQGDH